MLVLVAFQSQYGVLGVRWDKIVVVEASTLSTDFVCLSVSQTCANYLANHDLNKILSGHLRIVIIGRRT